MEVEDFEALVRRHERMLHAYALGILKDPALAEDVLQEALMIGFRNRSNLKKAESFPGWMRAIACNVALQVLKKMGREISADPEVLAGMEDVFSRFDDPGKEDLWTERIRVIGQCLDRLPEAMLTVCRLHYFEDVSAKAIAERLKISLGAVLKRLERSRDAIRLCVERDLGGLDT